MLPQMIAAVPRADAARARPRCCWAASGLASGSTTARRGFPAANSSASRSSARWPTTRKSCLADEPTGNLDHTTGEHVIANLIEIVRDSGLAALIATHNLDLARRLDRIVALEDGRLRAA